MAGIGAIPSTKPQKQTLGNEKDQQDDPKKFNYHLLYKASIVLIFFVILPLFPSQAPQFINQSLLTKNWELLHLLFVGIAISYGLFSHRNNETDDKDNINNNNSKFDTAQSLVSRFLQVSSFFEEDELAENPLEPEIETKVQTWSHQHIRNKPVMVMAPQGQHFEDHHTDKPLLLPVRSLKSRLSDDGAAVQSAGGASYNRSFSSKSKENQNLVLPSPIPWKSRSARITEPKLQVELNDNSVYQPSSKPSMEESEFNTKVESRSMKHSQSQTSRNSSSSLSRSESLAKNAEDSVKKKSFYKFFPPPPPPPPPPTMFHKSFSMKPIPRYDSVADKELKRSFTSETNSSMNRNYAAENMSMGKSIKAGQRTVGLFSRDREIGKELGTDDEEKHAISMQETKTTGKNIVESEDDEETESEDEDEVVGEGRRINIEKENETEESSKTADIGVSSSSSSSYCSSETMVGDEGPPDVDKKADEFIAKFREQIRLQRIDSIKRSTTRINARTNSSR